MNTVAAKPFYGWRVASGAFVLVFAGYGAFYTLPVFYPAFVQQYGWSRGEVALAGALALLITGLASPLIGTLIDRHGARPIMAAGMMLVSFALILISFAQSLLFLYAAALVFGLGLSGVSVLPVQILMAKWFVAKRGLATGIVISGMGLGGTVGPVLIAAAIPVFGIQGTFIGQAVVLLVLAIPVSIWLLRESPGELGLVAYGAASAGTGTALPQAAAPALSAPEAMRTAAFWFIAAGTFLAMFCAISVIQHLVLYLQGLQFELGSASRLLSTLLLSSVIGRVVLGWLSDRLRPARTLLVAYAILSVGTIALLLAQSAWQLLASAVLIGLGYGGSIVLLTLTTAEVFGYKSLGKILGTLLIFFTAGGALGPVVVGYLADGYGSYTPGFIAAIVAAALAAIASVGILSSRTQPSPPLATGVSKR